MVQVSDFSKQQILEIYDMMIKFVSFQENITQTDLYLLQEKISRHRIGIPKEIFDKIISFVEVNFSNMVGRSDFEWCYDDDCGSYDYTGNNFIHNNMCEFQNYIERQLEVFHERLRLVEEFGMRELYPVLTGDSPVVIGKDNTVFQPKKWFSRGINVHRKARGLAMSANKIIEALENERGVPVRNVNRATDEVHTRTVSAPDWNTALVFFNDDYKTIEVGLIDKNTGEEFCRHVFNDIGVFNAYLGRAFAPPEETNVAEGCKRPYIVEHKLR